MDDHNGHGGVGPVPGDHRLFTMGLFVSAFTGVRNAVEADLEPQGLTGSEFEVLIRLATSPEQRLRMSELAQQSLVSNSGLTRVVDRLRASGLVERIRHDRDRRVFYAAITPAGRAQVDAVLPAHLRRIDLTITEVLDAEELAAFLAALKKVRAAVHPSADRSS